MRVYLNGALVGRNDYTGSFSALKYGDLNRLGRTVTADDLDPPFQGQLDEVRVWSVARTEEQIRETMSRKMTGTEPGLVGLWNFDDPANPGRDSSPGGHRGTFMGNARVVPSDDLKLQSPRAEDLVLALDGESNLETDAVVVNTSGEYTVECWAFATASARGELRHLVSQDNQFYLGTNPDGKIRVGDW